MAKLALKVPAPIKTVVSVEKDVAEAWYSAPRNLGRLEYRGSYWFTQDGKRFVSSRDALEYLISLEHAKAGIDIPIIVPRMLKDKVKKEVRTRKQGATKSEPSAGPTKDTWVNELIAYLLEQPEMLAALEKKRKASAPLQHGMQKVQSPD
jgi:hypothetical protein